MLTMNLFHIVLESMHYTAEFLDAIRALGVSPPGPLVVGRENVPSLLGIGIVWAFSREGTFSCSW